MPGSLSRAQRFDAAAEQAAARLLRLNRELDGVDVVVEDVPRVGPRATEVPLGRVLRQTAKPQLVLHRRAIESRGADSDAQVALLRDVLAELAGDLLGREPAALDPAYPRES